MVLGTVLFYACLIIILNLVVDIIQAMTQNQEEMSIENTKVQNFISATPKSSSLWQDAWIRLRQSPAT